MGFRIALACCLIGLIVQAAPAQQADTVLTVGKAMATFQDAQAVALAPGGDIYVVDAGRNVVEQFAAGGLHIRTIGGPGAQQGQFDAPSGIDPTNGLVLFIADAGNGRIQRFSRDLLHLGSIPVGSAFTEGGAGAVQNTSRGSFSEVREAGGAPISVAVSTTGETFALDESRQAVLKWDAAHRPERIIGAYDSGVGALAEPVHIALDEEANLYVADPGRGAVLVYDRFGTFMRSLGDGLAAAVRSVTVSDGRIWIILPHRLLEYDRHGRLLHVLDLDLPEPLVDAAFHHGTAYLLTPTYLFPTALPIGDFLD